MLTLACGGHSSVAQGSGTCSGVCNRIAGANLSCAFSLPACTAACASQEGECSSNLAAYQSYLDCLEGASLSCVNGVLTAQCTEPTCGTTANPAPSSDAGPITGGDAGVDGTCAALATQASCAQCCDQGHSAGVSSFTQALLACECGASGACQTSCSTELCASPPGGAQTGDPCDTCVSGSLGTGGSCLASVSGACSADAACTAYTNCVAGCNQAM